MQGSKTWGLVRVSSIYRGNVQHRGPSCYCTIFESFASGVGLRFLPHFFLNDYLKDDKYSNLHNLQQHYVYHKIMLPSLKKKTEESLSQK